MGIISSLTTAGLTAGTALSTLNKDKTVNTDKRNSTLMTTTSTTATAVGGATLSDQGVDRIYEKYSSAYVDSMTDEQISEAQSRLAYLDSLSDEEFELLLQQTGQLERPKTQNNDVKTI